MNLLKINNLQKTFGGNLLFDHVSLDVNSSDKVALIGRNGVGKSTLVKMILGEIAPDAGDIFIYGGAVIGYLSQNVLSGEEHTLLDEMKLVFSPLIRLEEELAQVSSMLVHDHSESIVNRYASLEERYRTQGGYQYLTDIDMMLTKFEFLKTDYNRLVKSFSGGEKTRIAFAKLLLSKPDLLLLDEPTNHMDIDIIEWLEDYLRHYDGAVLVITHDRYFIDRVVNKIYELDQETMFVYHGKFEDYESQKAERYEQLMKMYIRQQKEIAHLQSFVDRFRYKKNLAKTAQDRIKKIARIERIDKPTNHQRHVKVSFHSKRPTDAIILECESLAIGYDHPLFPPFDFQMRGFEKVGIIGPNGVGKSTFVKTLIEELMPLSGNVKFNKQMKIGYFDQNATLGNENVSLIDYVHHVYPTKTLGEIRTLLAKVLFTGEDGFKSVSVLSGGEKVRLRLLMLMLEEPELLILDEPTNHLDLDTKAIVEDVFEEYIGPIIFISHDRYFINKVASKIVSLHQGVFDVFDGNYDEFKAFQEASKVQEPKVPKTKERKASPKKEADKLEKQLDAIHEEVQDLKQSLFDEFVYSNPELYRETESKIKILETEAETLLERLVTLSQDETS